MCAAKHAPIYSYKSITWKLLFPMLLVLIIQAFLFTSVILLGGTVSYLDEISADILIERVASRRNNIQNEMIHRWSNLAIAERQVNAAVGYFLAQNDTDMDIETLLSSRELTSELLETLSPYIIAMMRTAATTGGFIILNDSGLVSDNPAAKTGLYFRDMDPLSIPSDNSDILVERSPVSIIGELKIPTGTNWASHFFLKEEASEPSDLFYKPFIAGQMYPLLSTRNLGYWNPLFRLGETDEQVITYSIPLRRRDEEPYGVLGVEISLDYLHSMLPYSELNRERNGTYLVGLTSPDKPEYDIIISSKSPYSSRAMPGSGGVVLFENEPYMGSIYPTTSRAGVYGCMQYFDLYDVNTPFEMEQWVLLGLIDRSDLFSASINVMNSVFISLVVSLLIGIIGVGIAAVAFTRPIVGLAARVRRSDPDGPIKLPRCNINEVDELTAAVEALSRDVATSASRMSQVISLLNMPITVFMYQQGSDRVYCSDSFFDVTGSEIPGEQGLYISKEIFERRMAAVTTDPDAEDADLYRIVDDLGEQHWIRIRIKREMVGSMEKTLGIITDVTEETLEKRKIEHDRDYDGLTKLLNRHAFRALVTKKLAENPEGVGAFIMWDLDNLKYINDSYGHDMGDIYISTMADFIRHLSMDRGIVARMSGDEFFAFLYEYDSKDEIRRIIEQIQEKMQNTWLTLPDGKNVKVRASAGIAWYPDNAQTYEELARFSDFAMYEIKNTLKGTYFEFDERNYHRDSFLLTCKGELDKIIDEELLKYAFQPIVDARTGAIYAYEALMRSQSENLSSPQDIIRLARSQAKLYQIERLTWFKALECYAAHEELFGDTLLFINSVPSYVLNDQDLDEFETKYRPFLDRIVIELLEGDQSDEDCTLKKKELIALWRGKIAIDDFGSGYNNELILLMVRPDFVKIDMSIITSIDLDTKKQYIVQNLISYARNMGIKILAEGVETRGEMEMLISLGVDYMQGYYLGKPLFEPSQLSPEIQEQILTTAALYAPQSAVEA